MVTMKTISAMKARKNLGGLLEAVLYRGDRFVIERAGRPMAALVPLWDLEEWKKNRDRLSTIIEEGAEEGGGSPSTHKKKKTARRSGRG